VILSIWVYFMVGDPTPAEPGIAYVQATCPAFVHDTDHAREALEQAMQERFEHDYPGHLVAECGWRRQEVKVMGE
jgi:hypothetical protein